MCWGFAEEAAGIGIVVKQLLDLGAQLGMVATYLVEVGGAARRIIKLGRSVEDRFFAGLFGTMHVTRSLSRFPGAARPVNIASDV